MAAFAGRLDKGRGADERRAKLVGTSRGTMRPTDGEDGMRKTATIPSGTSEGPRTLVVPEISEHETAQEFSAIIIPFTTGELAQAAKRGKEAAKKWKEGRSLPSAWSMMNMAREIPAVRNYMLAKLGIGPHLNFNSPQGMDALAQAVNFVAALQGADADRLRAIMSGKVRQ